MDPECLVSFAPGVLGLHGHEGRDEHLVTWPFAGHRASSVAGLLAVRLRPWPRGCCGCTQGWVCSTALCLPGVPITPSTALLQRGARPSPRRWVQSISAEVVGPGCASQGGHCFRTLQPALLLLCRKLCQPQSTGGLPGDLAASSPPGEHGSSASPPQVGAAGREGGRASTEAVGLTLLLGEPVGPITQGWRVFSKA